MTRCNTPFDPLNAYVDGQLAPAEELELRRHLDVCETCRSGVETLLALKNVVAGSAETRPVPHTLRQRLGTLAERSSGRSFVRGWGLAVVAAALAAGLLLALGVTRWRMLGRSAEADVVAEALVTDHVHFLAMPDALEIASRDPQQIAEWFRDKVAFPVRVPELHGADLLGARLCSLWGHKVALAFYETQGKRLSVFITDPTTFPSRSEAGCRTALGDYRVCMIPTSSTVLAAVGETAPMAAVQPELEAPATRRQ